MPRELTLEEVLAAEDWFNEHWCTVVAREVGDEHKPLPYVGARFEPSHKDDYIAKLGLEIADPGIKLGRHKGRTPMQLLADFVDRGDDKALALYRYYARAMKGRKFLNWSRGLGELKKAADAELERQKQERMQRPPIAVIDGEDVDEFKHKDGALVAILECAEKDGLSGVLWALRKYHGDGAARRCLMLTQLEQRAVARAQAPPVKVEPEAQAPPAPPPKAEAEQMALLLSPLYAEAPKRWSPSAR